jgi:hypothetical protein
MAPVTEGIKTEHGGAEKPLLQIYIHTHTHTHRDLLEAIAADLMMASHQPLEAYY